MKTIKVLNEHPIIKKFYNLLNSTSRSNWETYCDFLQLSIDSLISDFSAEHPREQDYMQILSRYNRDDAKRFPEMFGCIMAYMAETNSECLSQIWEGVAANANFGQFFTPWNISIMMAKMQMDDINWSNYSPLNKYLICDPSCGGGRTLAASINFVPIDKIDCVCCHGVDIDLNVCHIAALNMLFLNANSFIIHGDSLSLTAWHVFQTIHTPFGGEIYEISDPIEMKKIITQAFSRSQPTEKNQVLTNNIQEDFFYEE